MRQSKHQESINQSGFTLIEVLIVVAIIGVIAAFAFPAYQDNVRKARRSDAQQLMVQISNRQEQYILDARSYSADPTVLGVAREGWTCVTANCSNNFYTVTITLEAGPPPGYKIKAVAKNDQLSDGDLGYNLNASDAYAPGIRSHNGENSW
jgi:type IV pilus assembly protein PilE